MRVNTRSEAVVSDRTASLFRGTLRTSAGAPGIHGTTEGSEAALWQAAPLFRNAGAKDYTRGAPRRFIVRVSASEAALLPKKPPR